MTEGKAMDIRVGDIVMVNSGERVPADMVIVYTTDKSSTVFIKTDQLDGETDWKVRRPINQTQSKMTVPEDLVQMCHAEVRCEAPTNLIYEFNAVYYDKDD
jgi:phospholipid-translocating ATPase